MLDSKQKHQLIELACQFQKQAYAPYSKYNVGAALMTASGQIIGGANVENASFSLTCCAERTALFSAVASGVRAFIAMAVVTQNGGAPCGACRQVLHEFAPSLPILLCNEQGDLLTETSIDLLLPQAFGPHDMEREW